MRLTAVLLAVLSLAGAVSAQPVPDAPKPAQPPTLDELLGLKSGHRPRAAGEEELQQELSLREAADGFEEAVGLMGQTASRIGDARDTGLQTQRMQESVIRKLDVLIKAAEQQARKSRASRSSRPQQNSRDPSQQPNQPQRGDQNQENRGDNREELLPPGRRDGSLGPEQSRGAAWGALPARVRDALLQGTQDTYSSVYQRLTESYFRKLAEEPRR